MLVFASPFHKSLAAVPASYLSPCPLPLFPTSERKASRWAFHVPRSQRCRARGPLLPGETSIAAPPPLLPGTHLHQLRMGFVFGCFPGTFFHLFIFSTGIKYLEQKMTNLPLCSRCVLRPFGNC